MTAIGFSLGGVSLGQLEEPEHKRREATVAADDKSGVLTGCPAWGKPRTFEANPAISERESLWDREVGQRLPVECRVSNDFSGHQFASFASATVDEIENFVKRIEGIRLVFQMQCLKMTETF